MNYFFQQGGIGLHVRDFTLLEHDTRCGDPGQTTIVAARHKQPRHPRGEATVEYRLANVEHTRQVIDSGFLIDC
jgi:hypothetical protein